MISQSTVELTIPFAKQVVNRGFVGVAIDNSPISELNHEAIKLLGGERLGLDIGHDQDKRLACTVESLLENSRTTMGANGLVKSTYSEKLDEVVKNLHENISPHVKFIPQVVNPFIRELVEKVEERVNQVNTEELLDVGIKIVPFPRFVTNGPFATAILKYSQREYNTKIKISPVINEMMPDEVLNRLKTGSVTIDSEIRTWLEYQGTNDAVKLANEVFSIANVDSQSEYLGPILNDPDKGIYNALVIYLVGQSLKNNLPEIIKGNSSDVKIYCDIISSIAGNALVKQLKLLLIKREQNVVVYKYTDKMVHVFEDGYAKFIEEGGKNEILQGALFSQDRAFSQKALMEKASHYESLWSSQLAYIRKSEKTHKAILTEQYANEIFRDMLLSEPNESRLSDADIASVNKKFIEVYRSLNQSQKEDLGLSLTIAVCDSRFLGTPSKEILLNTREVLKDNPELKPEDAATLGFAIYISDWIASLIEFKPIS